MINAFDTQLFLMYMCFFGIAFGFLFAIIKALLIDPFLRKTP